MTESPGKDTEKDTEKDAQAEWERKRRLAAVFGDVLPDTTSDEREPGSSSDGSSSSDEWLKAQVPPHHGE
ncbi:MAG: hypothetical protein Q7J48_07785 [Nocardioides sp.]|nr:hypothetical protein [Nocardioides sp.]